MGTEYVGTYFIFLDFVIRNLSVILWKLLQLEGVSISKSIAPEYVTVKVPQDLKLMSTQWNQQFSKYVWKVNECLEQNIWK